MSLFKIILALICFGLGYIIAGSSGSTISPVYLIGLIAGALAISMIVRYINSRNDK